MTNKINSWLKQTNAAYFSIYAIAAAFITYFSMYAFRKPFTAGVYEGFELWGVNYKIIAVITQVLGYTLSKFVGIKIIAELKQDRRIPVLLNLMAIAWAALFLFGVIPAPWNVFALFLNGLPLGMIWGVVFSYLEGRRFTELLGTGMSTSFIVSSGVVKATGRGLVYSYGISEFWMPFLTGAIFIPFLLLGIYMLKAIPAPSDEDRKYRTDRIPMDGKARMTFFKTFSIGIVLTVLVYISLAVFRDIRDNFAVEIWNGLGFADQPEILATTEIPVALSVLIIIGLMSYLKNNRMAFYMNYFIITLGGVFLIITTWMYQQGLVGPVFWMILNGFSMYLAYICFQTFLFERWIALYKYKSNIGFLLYVSDAFGYLGSLSILFLRNFTEVQLSWLIFFTQLAYITGAIIFLIGLGAVVYFLFKEKKITAPAEELIGAEVRVNVNL